MSELVTFFNFSREEGCLLFLIIFVAVQLRFAVLQILKAFVLSVFVFQIVYYFSFASTEGLLDKHFGVEKQRHVYSFFLDFTHYLFNKYLISRTR